MAYTPPPAGVTLTDDRVARRYASNIEYRPVNSQQDGDTCLEFPENAKPAIVAALNIWSTVLNSPVPIRVSVCWARLDARTLAQAGPTDFVENGNILRPVALANALAGRDILPNSTDIEVTINSTALWHLDPQNPIPAAQSTTHFDLTTNLLHELAHGFGFFSTEEAGAGIALWGNGSLNSPYDTFLQDANGNALTNRAVYPNNSLALLNAFRSNQVVFNGAQARAANAGRPVSIHSPSPYEEGSSISHVAEAVFGRDINNINRLMSPRAFWGDRNHNPGPIAIAMLRDIGWGTVPVPVTPPGVAVLRAPNGVATATPTYQWNAVLNAADYLLRVTNSSTNAVVFQQWVMASAAACQTAVCSYKPTLTLPIGSYRWQVQARGAGGTGALSTAMNFTIRPTTVPPASTPSYPTGTITNRSPAFTWSAANTAADYYLQIINRTTGAALYQAWVTNAQAGCATGTVCRFSRTLSVGNYMWRIMPRNVVGNGPASAYLNFTVQ
ncbi:hypothetical protein [uncultured Thiothrix sp.]|uniref:hypothetical protein n=1 Tax=uncultured Thiothrix sp. TaxID=223185 RepID=UPI00262FBD16|nr:hypothetical protein [uncultured Thiothrix sp.]